MYGRVIAKCLQKEMYECEKRTLKYKYKKKMQNFDEVLHFLYLILECVVHVAVALLESQKVRKSCCLSLYSETPALPFTCRHP